MLDTLQSIIAKPAINALIRVINMLDKKYPISYPAQEIISHDESINTHQAFDGVKWSLIDPNVIQRRFALVFGEIYSNTSKTIGGITSQIRSLQPKCFYETVVGNLKHYSYALFQFLVRQVAKGYLYVVSRLLVVYAIFLITVFSYATWYVYRSKLLVSQARPVAVQSETSVIRSELVFPQVFIDPIDESLANGYMADVDDSLNYLRDRRYTLEKCPTCKMVVTHCVQSPTCPPRASVEATYSSEAVMKGYKRRHDVRQLSLRAEPFHFPVGTTFTVQAALYPSPVAYGGCSWLQLFGRIPEPKMDYVITEQLYFTDHRPSTDKRIKYQNSKHYKIEAVLNDESFRHHTHWWSYGIRAFVSELVTARPTKLLNRPLIVSEAALLYSRRLIYEEKGSPSSLLLSIRSNVGLNHFVPQLAETGIFPCKDSMRMLMMIATGREVFETDF